jgi:creatinine amidohydrolase
VEAAEHGGRTVVVLPVGSLEQHGPHMPLGTDTLLAEHIARAAVDTLAEVPLVVAPALNYGCSHHHLPFGGTASMRTEQLLAVLGDVVGSLLVSGFGGVFMLNGHGGNQEVVQLVARDLQLTHDAHIAAGSYFQIARESLVAAGVADLGELPGHAGAFETSLMLAVRPELVRLSAVPRREKPAQGWPRPLSYRLARPGPFRGADGFSDDPGRADAAKGALLLDLCVTAVSAALLEFHQVIAG